MIFLSVLCGDAQARSCGGPVRRAVVGLLRGRRRGAVAVRGEPATEGPDEAPRWPGALRVLPPYVVREVERDTGWTGRRRVPSAVPRLRRRRSADDGIALDLVSTSLYNIARSARWVKQRSG